MSNITTVGTNNQLTFNGCLISVVNHNNQIWFTSSELAKALGYATSRAVTKLYNQNSDEFSNGMTEVSVLGTSGNLRKSVRIFSLRGAHLIAMFARTKIAKAFRKWVLDILDREYKIEVLSEETSTQKTTVDQRTPLRDAVNLLVSKKGITYSEAYSVVHQRFNVSSIEELELDQLPQAVEYVHRIVLEGEYIAKETTSRQIAVNKTNLACLINSMEWIYKYYNEYNLLEVSRMLQSDFGAKLHDHIISGYTSSKSLV